MNETEKNRKALPRPQPLPAGRYHTPSSLLRSGITAGMNPGALSCPVKPGMEQITATRVDYGRRRNGKVRRIVAKFLLYGAPAAEHYRQLTKLVTLIQILSS